MYRHTMQRKWVFILWVMEGKGKGVKGRREKSKRGRERERETEKKRGIERTGEKGERQKLPLWERDRKRRMGLIS